jgi:hypothetical protein
MVSQLGLHLLLTCLVLQGKSSRFSINTFSFWCKLLQFLCLMYDMMYDMLYGPISKYGAYQQRVGGVDFLDVPSGDVARRQVLRDLAPRTLKQGCQLVYFQTKNRNLGKFGMGKVGILYDHF